MAAYSHRTITVRDGLIVRDGPSPKRGDLTRGEQEYLGQTARAAAEPRELVAAVAD